MGPPVTPKPDGRPASRPLHREEPESWCYSTSVSRSTKESGTTSNRARRPDREVLDSLGIADGKIR
jgi:hypothetical protein